MERGCLTAIGVMIALVSAFFVAGGIVQLATGGDGTTSRTGSIGLIVVFGPVFLAGAYLVWRMLWQRSGTAGVGDPAAEAQPVPPSEADRERQVLRFAETEHGRVTIPEVAANCDMTIAEAKTTLDRLVTLQAATIQVAQAGVLVYVFPGFMTDEDKARAGDF
jgi:hypothetical protein